MFGQKVVDGVGERGSGLNGVIAALTEVGCHLYTLSPIQAMRPQFHVSYRLLRGASWRRKFVGSIALPP